MGVKDYLPTPNDDSDFEEMWKEHLQKKGNINDSSIHNVVYLPLKGGLIGPLIWLERKNITYICFPFVLPSETPENSMIDS
jgi:hypothetical protein